MDYQELIESHINECRHRIDVIRNYMNANGDADKDVCNKNIEVLKIAISAMQEMQAIHNNGISLERLKDIDFRKQVVEHINYMDYMDIKDELEEYKQLGTLEEVREAVDRQQEKQIINISKGDKLRFGTCPICNRRISTVEGGNYCQNCGQRLNWSDKG